VASKLASKGAGSADEIFLLNVFMMFLVERVGLLMLVLNRTDDRATPERMKAGPKPFL
jgi:hypothetical protein